MCELAIKHLGNDFHVTVSMGSETLASLNPVFIDDEQRPEACVARIVVVPKRESVLRVEPAKVGKASVFTFT